MLPILFAATNEIPLGNAAQFLSALIAVIAAIIAWAAYRASWAKTRQDLALSLLGRWNDEKLFALRQQATEWLRSYDKDHTGSVAIALRYEIEARSRQRQRVTPGTEAMFELLWKQEAAQLARQEAPNRAGWRINLAKEYANSSEEDRPAAFAIYRVVRFFVDLHVLYHDGLVDRQLARRLFGPFVRDWDRYLQRFDYDSPSASAILYADPEEYARWSRSLRARIDADDVAQAVNHDRPLRVLNMFLHRWGVNAVWTETVNPSIHQPLSRALNRCFRPFGVTLVRS
jgi:hypothetical protein